MFVVILFINLGGYSVRKACIQKSSTSSQHGFEFHQVQCLCFVYVDGREAHGTQKLQFIVTSAGLFHFDKLLVSKICGWLNLIEYQLILNK